MIGPATRVRLALRAALRRRYGYAALRALRRGVGAAMADHLTRSVDGSRPYASQLIEIRDAYWQALRRLRKRWPDLELEDPRSRP